MSKETPQGQPHPQGEIVEHKIQNRFMKIEFSSVRHRLVANLYLPDNSSRDQTPGVFFIHGGGPHGKSKVKNLQRYLCDNGFGSFAYDSSGFGESGGVREEETLESRLEDAERGFDVFQQYFDPDNSSVVGMSMGADIAINLTGKKNIHNLLLLAPAAYPEEARTEPLQLGFTRRIRTDKESWQDAPVFSRLQEYSGSVLIMYGENDRIIPGRMRKKFRGIIENKGEFLVLSNASHNFLRPHTDLEVQAEQVAFSEIARFLSSSL